MSKRTFYQDKWNKNKVWEAVKLSGGFYLRQYICGKQYGRGIRTTKKFISSIRILEMAEVPGVQRSERQQRRLKVMTRGGNN